MKSYLRNFLVCAALIVPAICFARWNPAVQNSFFQDLEQALPAQQPPPLAIAGGVLSDVNWAGLAWAVNNVKTTHRPLIISFYSADPNTCVKWNLKGVDDCGNQVNADFYIANHYAGQIDVVRINVQFHPQVMNGPDVQSLPTHFFIGDYTDSQHYTAVKVWGLMDEQGLEQLIQQTFNIGP